MKVEIRLKKILEEHKLDKHGIAQRIARDIGVHRHTISKLYYNRSENPSLDVLGKLCKWLHEEANVPADSLPGKLFGARPSQLLQAISETGHVKLVLGEYRQCNPPMRWIAVPDATVNTHIVRSLSELSEGGGHVPEIDTIYIPFRFTSGSSKITKKQFQEDMISVRRIFDDMRNHNTRKLNNASILIGSQRVNHLLELFVADLFECEPFTSSDRQRKVPFYLAYRSSDLTTPSCFGGSKPPTGYRGADMPGIYYRKEDGKWGVCPWKKNEQNSGVVIVVREPGLKTLEMAIFGFSGQATSALGSHLFLDDRFWPPHCEAGGKEIGIYICRLELQVQTPLITGEEEILEIQNCEVIPLSESTLEKHLG